MNKLPSVSIIGLGYIGLPMAGLLAAKGFQVYGCDTNPSVVDVINSGNVHIVEKDLEQLISRGVKSNNLRCYTQPQAAQVFLIAVPTPFTENHVPDLTYVKKATKNIASVLQPGNLVILESTSPVGTTEHVARWLVEERPDLNVPLANGERAGPQNAMPVYIAHCPERVLPGQIIHELVENDRIIGGLDEASSREAESFYQHFVNGGFLSTDARTAELVKLTENAFRDVNIAFANELSLICDQLKINVWELIRLANRHPRVNILQPGPGVGGHCIAVDPWFIVHSAAEQAQLIATARKVNNHKASYVYEKIKLAVAQIANPKIACLGLSYKPNIDDLRESSALHIVEQLAQENIGELFVVEPHIKNLPPTLSNYKQIHLSDYATAFAEADLIVLLVAHSEFLVLDKSLIKSKVVIDTVGVWS